MNLSRVRDISRSLTPGHPNWPGDAPFSVEPAARIANGDTVNTGVLSTSTHTGTHVDAPWHYDDAGVRLHDVPLDVYLGRARVIHATGHALVPASVLDGLDDLPERLLVYTGQPAHWADFPQDFTALSPEFVRAAHARGVRLVGTDSPSVDPLDSKTLDAHHTFAETGLFIVEGLNLAGVPEGEYDLVCLALPLHGVDGSPARAILLERDA
ncbi:cyclase family protein [Deinococcus maricopensis]|uniref:Kynurenine formamidase n=1 Tax=Deinococcus maricopensis (strain DSM 21211 / LMG 22137 / NRRL B-23946 / LB-34) TaxID=709986 RepID=E8U822_DEIML|nr:cyclase family protein [Deinococcus maricopensis]ADV67211.1 Arylformamidase [Deinococcus maricopensis DSM 21211]